MPAPQNAHSIEYACTGQDDKHHAQRRRNGRQAELSSNRWSATGQCKAKALLTSAWKDESCRPDFFQALAATSLLLACSTHCCSRLHRTSVACPLSTRLSPSPEQGSRQCKLEKVPCACFCDHEALTTHGGAQHERQANDIPDGVCRTGHSCVDSLEAQEARHAD